MQPKQQVSVVGGEGGIRTLDNGDRYTGFRVRRIRPLCHLSTPLKSSGYKILRLVAGSKVCLFLTLSNFVSPNFESGAFDHSATSPRRGRILAQAVAIRLWTKLPNFGKLRLCVPW